MTFSIRIPTVKINTLSIYKAAIPISMGYTVFASIFSMHSLGFFDLSNTLIIRDVFSINVMFFSFIAIFSAFIFIIFTNLHKLVKLKEDEIAAKNIEVVNWKMISNWKDFYKSTIKD